MLLRRKWRVFRVFGLFWGVLGDFGAQTRHFFSFFGVTSPLREGVGVLEITPHLLNGSGHRRRLVRRTVERLVQLLHSAWSRRLSLENWCFGSENGLFFGFEGYFEVFWAIWGCKTGVITHFLTLSLHLCTGVEVLGITPHLLNVRVQATAHGQYGIRL